MDNLGDWLYIVFLIIAVISGLFSEKKKKKSAAKPVQPQRQMETSTETEGEKGFWEILEEMQNGPQPVKPRPKKVPEKKQVTVKKAKAAVASSPFLSGESISSTIRPKQNDIILEEANETELCISNEDFHLQDVNEVRKAILYSEILNRKY